MAKTILESFSRKKVTSPSHTRPVFNPESFLDVVDKAAEKIEKIRVLYPEIEALAACGNSGVLLVGALAARLKMPVLVVRKKKDTNNDDRLVNGYIGAKGYLIIDDVIDSGATVRHIITEIQDAWERSDSDFIREGYAPRFIGALLYNHSAAPKPKPTWFGTSTARHWPGFLWEIDNVTVDIDWSANGDVALAKILGGPIPNPMTGAQRAMLKLITNTNLASL
jgi:hypothetical protein